jgi:alcohol dehydrogenase
VLEKSIRVLKPGGKLISIAGSPDSDFAKELGLSRILRLVMYFMSYRIRGKAKRHHVSYSFHFMRPSGDQLREISSLIDSGIIRPVVDRVFPFESTKEALAYVEKGRAKGKVIVKVR